MLPEKRTLLPKRTDRRFLYQRILPSKGDAAITSTLPSRSRSTAVTDGAPGAVEERTCARPKRPLPSRFSYHAIVLSSEDAERTSRSPSPSRSAAKTDEAPAAAEKDVHAAPEHARTSDVRLALVRHDQAANAGVSTPA